MKNKLGFLTAGILALPLVANAAIISTDAFVGDVQEGFERNFISTTSLSVFGGDATLSVTQTTNTTITVTSSWAGGQLSQIVNPLEGTRFAGVNGYGLINFNFTESIESFGGYFNSLFMPTTTMPSTIKFYENDNLIETLSFSTGYGNWLWQGWTTTGGETFDRVEINSNVYNSAWAFVLMDSLQAGGALAGDDASVPEPGSLALIGLGLAGLFGVRRQKHIR